MEDCYDEILVLCNDKRDQQEKFNYILDRLNRFNYIRFIYPNYISSAMMKNGIEVGDLRFTMDTALRMWII